MERNEERWEMMERAGEGRRGIGRNRKREIAIE